MIKLEDPYILTSHKYFMYNFCFNIQLSTVNIIANWAVTNILLLQSKWRFFKNLN